jgi:hypothetical protein
MAVGVGARKALAASAAINWMLKDGMNRLVRMGVATQFGDSFDSDLKVGVERPGGCAEAVTTQGCSATDPACPRPCRPVSTPPAAHTHTHTRTHAHTHTHTQRFRFQTSVLYTVCVSCEFLTPRYPSHFLLLTAVSNVGRAVGLTTFVSTQPAFQQALCAGGNMADLASKTQVWCGCAERVCMSTCAERPQAAAPLRDACFLHPARAPPNHPTPQQAQHMVMDTLALAVSASANYVLRHKEAQRMLLPLIAFPICGLLDLFCIYHELKSVQLRSLNRERAEMVAQHWLQHGKVCVCR